MTESRARSFGAVAAAYAEAGIRAYLVSRLETSAGEFVLPLHTDVLRAVRR